MPVLWEARHEGLASRLVVNADTFRRSGADDVMPQSAA